MAPIHWNGNPMAMLDRRITTTENPRQRLDRGIWQWSTSNKVVTGLLALLACFLGLGYFLPQVPAQIRSDPVSYQEWLSAAQAQFKSWTTLLEAVGVFHIYETPWFLLLLAALTFAILVSLSSRVIQWLQPLDAGWLSVLQEARQVTVVSVRATGAQAVEAAWMTINAHLGHTTRQEYDGGTRLYGGRNVWVSASVVATYLGLLLLLSGLAINGRWGWRQSGIRLLPGEPAFVGKDASHRIQLLDARNGSEIVLEVAEGQRVVLKPGVRTAEDGFRYLLTDHGGPLVQLSARNGAGSKLTLYDYTVRPTAVESLQFAFSPDSSQEEKDRLFIVSDEKVVGRLQWLNEPGQDGKSDPRFRLWVFLEDGRTAVGETELVAQDGLAAATVGGILYSLQIARYQVIDVDHQPGLWALHIGAVLISLGLLVSLIPRCELWLLVSETAGEVTIWALDRSAGLSRRFRTLRRDVLDELQGLLMRHKVLA